MKKVVLAYSGGLDTSYCVKYLTQEKNLEVHAVLVNTGGFTKKEIESTSTRAYSLGVKHFEALDVEEQFYQECVRYLIFGNVLKNNTYPLSVSAERVFQAMAIAKYALKTGAEFVAHGSTGAGNDQVRFDLIFQTICPNCTILTPIRDQSLSRKEEIEYLQNSGVDINWEKAKYSINQGLWGTSVGGVETLTSDQYLPEEAFPSSVTEESSKAIEIHFKKGEPCGVDGQSMSALEAIKAIDLLAKPYGIGRDIHIGDTIIGIKGRVGFEAAAPMIIIKAHHLLEKHTLTKWQIQTKDQMAYWYGNMVHEGQFLEPALRDIEAMLQNSQRTVTGRVKIELNPYRFHTIGVTSLHDLMNTEFGAYGEMNESWSGEDVKGFSRILGNQNQIYYKVNQDELKN